MGRFTIFWKWFSQTNLLDQLSGKLETDFFESVYRVTYIAGLSSSDRNIGYQLYSKLMKLMIFLYVCSELWYMFTMAPDLTALAEPISVVVLQFITVYRYENLMSNKPFFDKLVTSMNSRYFDISTETRKKLVEYWAHKNQKYLKLLLLIGNITLFIWLTYPLLDEVEYNLITEIRLPFHYKTPILYPVVYLLTTLSLIFCAYFVMVTSLTTQAHLIHLLCQFSVLADCFENVLDDTRTDFEGCTADDWLHNEQFAEKYTNRLRNLVEQHKLLLSHTGTLKTILSQPMLGQVVSSGIMMCSVGYQAIMTIAENVGNCMMAFMFLSYNVFDLYIVCRWSEDLTTWSRKIGEAIYCSGWECGVTKIRGVRTTVMLVIARANKPVVFTAGGMYSMSIASFGSLVKGSYSVLTVLLRFRHD